MEKRTKNQKMLEYYKSKFLEYANRVESDEEVRIATQYEVKVDMYNVVHYSAFLQGARRALLLWNEYENAGGEKAFRNAVLKLVTSDNRYMDMFFTGIYEIRFRNHQYNKKGKLEKVEAFFVDKVTVYKEV